MSKARPIQSSRALRSTPDEADPSFSYEQESFLGSKDVDVEDEFHRRLAGSRRDTFGSHGNGTSGNSFWRTTASSNTSTSSLPSFSSVNLKEKNGISIEKKGVLGTQLGVSERSNGIHARDNVSAFNKVRFCCE